MKLPQALRTGASVAGGRLRGGITAFGDAEMIRIAIKATVWGFLGLMALPSLVPADRSEIGAKAAPTTTPTETTVHAARFAGAMASEVGSACSRQPALCESGRALADAAVARAHQGLMIASDLVAKARAPGAASLAGAEDT